MQICTWASSSNGPHSKQGRKRVGKGGESRDEGRIGQGQGRQPGFVAATVVAAAVAFGRH